MAKSASTFSQVLPLVILFAFVGAAGFVFYHIYLSVAKIQESASQSMNKNNMVFTKDGMRVGVKHMKNENYVDATQSWVVKAWNLGTADQNKQPTKRK